MSEHTGIEWTDATWNPTTGCTKVSPACAHCYIERTPPFRIKGRKFVNGHIPLQFNKDRLAQPLRWKKPKRIFVNSLSDLFHADVPDAFIDRVFAVMAATQRHTFQVLTKRADRMRDYLTDKARWASIADQWTRDIPRKANRHTIPPLPLPNVWLGVSVENQHYADERIPLLLQTPAAVRFISAEPLLGPIDLTDLVVRDRRPGEWHVSALDCDVDVADDASFNGATLDWVIAGGESGPQARPSHPGWFLSLRDQCVAAGVAFHFKQWGEWANGGSDTCRDNRVMLTDGRALSWNEYQQAFSQTPGELNPTAISRVGKKAAGRLLDDREWNEFPRTESR